MVDMNAKLGNFSQQCGDNKTYPHEETLIQVRVVTPQERPMQNIENIIKDIVESAVRTGTDRPEISLRFHVSEIDLQIDTRVRCCHDHHDQDQTHDPVPIDVERTS